jgi:hypothetical protein
MVSIWLVSNAEILTHKSPILKAGECKTFLVREINHCIRLTGRSGKGFIDDHSNCKSATCISMSASICSRYAPCLPAFKACFANEACVSACDATTTKSISEFAKNSSAVRWCFMLGKSMVQCVPFATDAGSAGASALCRIATTS